MRPTPRSVARGALTALLCVASVALAVAPALAAPPRVERPVTDLAAALPPSEEQAIERRLVALREATGVQLAVLVVDTTRGQDIADFAQAAFDAWEGGSAERDDGVLFVLAISDRRNRLHVGYGLEAAIPDGAAIGMLDDLRPLLRAARYGDAALRLIDAVDARVARFHADPDAATGPPPTPLAFAPWTPLVLALLGFLAGLARTLWSAGADDSEPREPRPKSAGIATAVVLWALAPAAIAFALALPWMPGAGGWFAALWALYAGCGVYGASLYRRALRRHVAFVFGALLAVGAGIAAWLTWPAVALGYSDPFVAATYYGATALGALLLTSLGAASANSSWTSVSRGGGGTSGRSWTPSAPTSVWKSRPSSSSWSRPPSSSSSWSGSSSTSSSSSWSGGGGSSGGGGASSSW